MAYIKSDISNEVENMLKDIVVKIEKEISGVNIKRLVNEIYNIDRWFTFPKFHQTAAFCKQEMKRSGLNAVKIFKYPANGRTVYGDHIVPQAWDAEDAELLVLEPGDKSKRIAHYREEPKSLFMYSAPTIPGGIEKEVVLIEDTRDEENYKGKNIRGKIVFTCSHPMKMWRLAQKYGAIGIISDWSKDFRLYGGIKWENYCFVPKNRAKLFGFSISEKDGQYLKRLIRASEKTGRKVKVRAIVKTKLYDDFMDLVTGVIKGRGKKDEEVLIFAHLYEPGAWDNASGSATILEIARCLNELIAKGILPRPKRSIRFMLGFECYGLMAYLETQKEFISKIIAGLNIDSTGLDNNYGTSLKLHKNHPSNASYTDILLQRITEDYLIQKDKSFAWEVSPFGGGDSLPSDPMFGIPFPGLIQNGRSKIWHNSLDTPDKLNPEILKWVGTIAASYLYFIANAGEIEMRWLTDEIYTKAKCILANTAQKIVTGFIDTNSVRIKKNVQYAKKTWLALEQKLSYLKDCYLRELHSVERLFSKNGNSELLRHLARLSQEIKLATDDECAKARSALKYYVKRMGINLTQQSLYKKTTDIEEKASKMIPKRCISGILTLETLPEKIKKACSCKWGPGYQVLVKPILWTNEERSLLEISQLVEQETGETNLRDLIECYKFLEKFEYIKIKYR